VSVTTPPVPPRPPMPPPAVPPQPLPAFKPRRGRRPALVAIVVYALQACVPAKRRWFLALPCAAAVLFGLLATTSDEPDLEAFAVVADAGLFALVVPLGCLVIGDAVLGAEVRSGTLPFTWLSPVTFPLIVFGRWLAGWLVALLTLVPAVALSALVAGAPEAAGAAVIAAAAGSAAFIGLFVMIGCLVRRAAVWSLVFVFLVERLLGDALSGIAQWSPTWEARAVYAELAPGAEDLLRRGIPQGWGAVTRLAVITVFTLVVASWRLRHLRLTGASD
jgi:ABC-type transport system involved in cytochrome c biogenesis permease component